MSGRVVGSRELREPDNQRSQEDRNVYVHESFILILTRFNHSHRDVSFYYFIDLISSKTRYLKTREPFTEETLPRSLNSEQGGWG